MRQAVHLAALAAAFALGLVACVPRPRGAIAPESSGPEVTAPHASARPAPLSSPLDIPRQGPSAMSVQFLDVGQGDAALVTTSDGHALLVDAGPAESSAVVERALQRMGGSILDGVVLSHAHADHLGELDRLAVTLSFRSWIDPGLGRHAFPPYDRALAAVHARNIPVIVARRGAHHPVGAFVDAVLLAPSEPLFRGTRSDVNANSVVLRLDHHAARPWSGPNAGDVRVLFEGDAEHPTEKRLLEDPASLKSDVLKVAHHGSRFASSDALLRAASPRLAVISSARGNDYGHPHAATLRRLEEHHIEIARTDLQGTITVTSDAHGLAWGSARPASVAERATPGSGRHPDTAP